MLRKPPVNREALGKLIGRPKTENGAVGQGDVRGPSPYQGNSRERQYRRKTLKSDGAEEMFGARELSEIRGEQPDIDTLEDEGYVVKAKILSPEQQRYFDQLEAQRKAYEQTAMEINERYRRRDQEGDQDRDQKTEYPISIFEEKREAAERLSLRRKAQIEMAFKMVNEMDEFGNLVYDTKGKDMGYTVENTNVISILTSQVKRKLKQIKSMEDPQEHSDEYYIKRKQLLLKQATSLRL